MEGLGKVRVGDAALAIYDLMAKYSQNGVVEDHYTYVSFPIKVVTSTADGVGYLSVTSLASMILVGDSRKIRECQDTYGSSKW